MRHGSDLKLPQDGIHGLLLWLEAAREDGEHLDEGRDHAVAALQRGVENGAVLPLLGDLDEMRLQFMPHKSARSAKDWQRVSDLSQVADRSLRGTERHRKTEKGP
eukprot:773103-Rhodomonas_salina.7